jgi:amino acid transporter
MNRDQRDTETLSRLGYAQELLRGMGGFSSFALSFSIISVLTGIVTTFDVAIGGGGPGALGLGWPLVSIGTLVVALAMAELASAFPTAGALYHWSALLGGPGWGWFTAMTNLTGQVAIVAAIDLGCAKTLVATAGWADSRILTTYLVIVGIHGVLNVASVKIVGWLNDFSATVHVIGVIVLVGALALAKAQPLSFLGHIKTTRSDGITALGFVNALALGMYTFTGYDASAHVSEETHDASRSAPRGIVTSVAVSAVAGYALACALTLAIRDLPAVASSSQPALDILTVALGTGWGRIVMAFAVVAMWFCGLSSVTSASRTIFAFSRDGGLPGSRILRQVHPSTKTPIFAIGAAAILPCLLVGGTWTVSDKAFLAATSLATTALYVSYGLPIFLGARARSQGRWKKLGPWNLGSWGPLLAWLAVAWTLVVVAVFLVPPNHRLGLILFGVLAILAVIYVLFARGRFVGPRVSIEAIEKR